MGKQKNLPTMEEETDEELDKQCERLLEAQAEKHEAAGRFKDVHAKLLEMMQAKKLTVYKHVDSGKIFQAESTCKVKHKNLKQEKVPGGKGVNPDGPLDDDELDEPEPTGQSEIIDGLEELADEGPEGDEIKPKKRKKK